MRKWLVGPVVGAGLIGATLGLGVSAFAVTTNQAAEKRAETFRQLELFAEILARVESEYVVEIDEKAAIEASIEGMLTSLDPHSTYLDPEEFRDVQSQISGEYGGLGLEVTAEEGFVKVVAPMDGTPAARAGLKSGDFLTAIDGVSIAGLPLNDAVKQMRGEIGASITITVVREKVEPFDVTLTRESIRPEIVKFRAEGDIGYIRVATFNDRTAGALDDAIDNVRRQVKGSMKGLVLDLRDNPGGSLDASIEVSSRFLNGGEVVSTRGRRAEDVRRYNAARGERLPNVPVVVLINNGSASAAEIVAGALQDRSRAKVIGVTSFGKGSVQSVIPLGPQKGALRLTTSRYYTPSGRSIQASGIEPDVEVAAARLTDEEIASIEQRQARMSEAALPNALQNEQGVERRAPHIPADMPPADYAGEDYQLDKALELIRSGQAVVQRSVAQQSQTPSAN
jgi:carboxyl-terminal processing protease